ncbi:putative acetylglutamate kinase [Ilyonectria sp. MPI-CAGE-AT-0026]|nr:putative acetylglutamate kinase [Ilyonectria sp. MPI-CAGE-AT-0026]
MLSATSGAMRIGARRIAPRAAALAVTAMPKASLSRTANIFQARAISTTGRLAHALNTNPNPPLGKKNASNDSPSRIGLIGARGYTGQALIDLLNNHPNVDLRYVSSRELAGQELKGYTKRKIIYESLSPEDVAQLDKDGQVDCWVMALPNNTCQPFVEALGESSNLIVDLSADYRFDTTGTWTYSCPELVKRSTIAQSTRISNPGCYATGAQLGISPLVPYLGGVPTVFGVSGFSGAGTKKSPKNDETLLKDNLLPYSLTGHIHEREISHHLGATTAFIPHVASWFRGIQLTINIPLSKEMTSREIRQIYQDRYASEKLVKVVGEAPYVKSIQNKHGVEVGGFAVDDTGKRVVVCATIDNLNKGAATQCLQNMNLALGYDEYQGIPI